MLRIPGVRQAAGIDTDLGGATVKNFSILVQAMIGPAGSGSYESFDFVVCTPQWLRGELSEKGYRFGRHLLILEVYSFRVIWGAISSLCQRTWGGSWSEIAEKLGRFGRWEFEDYSTSPTE